MSVETLAPQIERTPKPEPQVAVAMLSLIGPETVYLPFCPLSSYRLIAEAAGAGLDFWPIRGLSALQVHYQVYVPNRDIQAITSASASFRAEKSLWQTLKHSNKKLAIMSRIALPHKDDVRLLKDISRLKHLSSGTQLPVVLDADTIEEARWLVETGSRLENGIVVGGIPNLVVQATENLFSRPHINIRTEAAIDHFLKRHNIAGFCFNTIESRFLEENPELLEAVLRRTILVYVKVFRNDSSDPKLSTAHGLDLINKSQQTGIYKSLEKIRKLSPNAIFILVTNISEVPKNPTRMGGDVILVPEEVGPSIKPLVDGIKATA